jgi:hypothetical protein
MGIISVLICFSGGKPDMYDAVGGVPRAGDLVNVRKTGHVTPGRYVVQAVEWNDHSLAVCYLNPTAI